MSYVRPQRLQAVDASNHHHNSSGSSATDLSHLLKLEHTTTSPIEGEEAQSASSSVTSSPTLSSSIAGVSTGLNPTFDESISVRRHMVAGTGSHPNLRELSRNKLSALNTNISMRGVAADDMNSPVSVSPSDTLLTRIPVVGGNVANSPASPLANEPHMSLRTPRNDWKVFDQGMRFGCMLSLLTWVMWDCIVDARLRPADQDLWVQLILPVYRGMGCLLLLGWCLGFSLYMWDKYHINYGFLMEVDLRTFLTATEVLDACVNATILYLANFLIYFKIMRGDFPNWIQAGYFPIAYLGWLLWKLLPWSHWFCNKPSRVSVVWASLVQVALAPFGKVTFLTGYLGDIWTSMVKVSVDLAYAGCLFVSGDWMVEIETLALTQNQNNAANAAANLANSALNAATNSDGVIPGTTPVVLPSSSAGDLNKIDTCFQSMFFKSALIPLLSALPLWLRFMQCLKRYVNTRKRWPHIGNACKYALAHSVILFGVYNSSTFQSAEATQNLYKASWILCMILSTLYTFAWDVFMDWGLGNMKFGGLREELMFPHRGVYYLAIIVDLFARFAWTLTLIPQGEDSPFSPDFVLYLQPSLAAGEILRRTMWGLFRLEWEHLSTQSYHRVPDAVAQAAPLPEMSGYKIIMEVSVLVVIVLSIGTTAALTAN